MSTEQGQDSNGLYYRWGKQGKKYHYKAGDVRSREAAKADAQGQAIYASK